MHAGSVYEGKGDTGPTYLSSFPGSTFQIRNKKGKSEVNGREGSLGKREGSRARRKKYSF